MRNSAAALLVAVVTGCATTSGGAPPAVVAGPHQPGERAKLAAEKPEQVCGKEAPLGSHLESRRCRTVESIEERRDKDQLLLLRPHTGASPNAGIGKLGN